MDNFKTFVEIKVSEAINNVFKQSHDWAKTQSGDITPDQKKELDALEKQLVKLVIAQTVQNIGTSKEESTEDLPIVQWTVPICRTGYGHKTFVVEARSEQEAIDKAIDEAGDWEFGEKDADYSAPDGASKL